MMANSASFEDQYDALRGGRGVVELADWSSMTVTGKDRRKFLNNFCTNDVNSLEPGDYCEAFFTNAKGRIIAHGRIECRDDELVFIGTPNQTPRLVEHLDRYIIREDVQLRDTSSERAYVFALVLPPAFSAHYVGEFGVLLEVAVTNLEQVRHSFHELGYTVCGMAAFDAIRIEAGIPLFGVDFNEHNFPQEVNRDQQAISFTKGCYLGQETVARIDALGHVNQKLVGLRFSGSDIPTAGAELTKAGTEVGCVTSAAYSPQLGAPLALAMVRREANAVGTALESPVGNCEVISVPLPSVDA
jgi:folate-binding protein YgfZ